MLLAIMFIRKILLCKTVQKFIALGLTPIINMADKIAKTKEPINLSPFPYHICHLM